MTSLRFYEIAEREHAIQNPTSEDKIRLLGERMRLAPDDHVVDLGSGRGGPALILAREFGCRVTGVELSPAFAEAALERARLAGVDSRVEFVVRDARDFALEPESYEAALCLGASFIWTDLPGTLEALVPAVRQSGHVVVGEPFFREWPLPAGYAGADEPFATLPGTVERLESAGLRLVTLIASSNDDWDSYESLHWRSLEEWLAEHPHDPEADAIRARHDDARERYVRWERRVLGWGMFAGRRKAGR